MSPDEIEWVLAVNEGGYLRGGDHCQSNLQPVASTSRRYYLRPTELRPVELLLDALERGIADRAVGAQPHETVPLDRVPD